MVIHQVATGDIINVTVERLVDSDLQYLTKKRYFFDWRSLYGKLDIYKLFIEADNDIKGLVAIEDHPDEYRIEVKLIAVSRENVIFDREKGRKFKEYENIAANLLAFAGKVALTKYSYLGCLSLLPKTELKQHYMSEYRMIEAGLSVYLDGGNLENLVIKHLV